MKKKAFIVWARYHRRSELLAQHLGASIHFINYGRAGQLPQAIVRYLVQAWQTWRILRLERPDVVFVPDPPVFAVLVVALFAYFHNARYVIDSHTGAFISAKWRWSVGLHRLLSRWALLTIVHNESQGRLVQSWGYPYLVVAFTPGDYPPGESYPLSEKFNIAVICSFGADEPLDILFEAARQLDDVSFYITGDVRRIDRRLLVNKPQNIFLTGYLSYDQYVGLLRGVSGIIDLVDNEYTLLMGAFEAVSLGVPLIVSDWPLLRNYFSQGTVYVSNTLEGVSLGISQLRNNHRQLQRGILLLQEQLQAEWGCKFEELQQIVSKG